MSKLKTVDTSCGTCKFWIPNGGYLMYGYCSKNKFTYRKINQTCKNHRNMFETL